MTLTEKPVLVHKTQLDQVEFTERDLPALNPGQVLFKIERYALTANNITYAVIGARMHYWEFFPAQEPWGIVPVWGFAHVLASQDDDIKEGEQFYGYFPMSDHLIVTVGNVKPHGFADISAHRKQLPSIYNYYARTATDPFFSPEVQDHMPIIKPLFSTSYLIYQHLLDNDFLGAQQVVLLSASSKTALALAFLLAQHKGTNQIQVVGITSEKNMDFVRSTGYYDTVLPYHESSEDGASVESVPTVTVDFAGNAQRLKSIATQLGESSKFIFRVGLTDWQGDKSFSDIPRSELFFAPTHMEERLKSWGPEKTFGLINKALLDFTQDTQKFMAIEKLGPEQLTALYLSFLAGKVDPKKGYIIEP